MKQVHKAVAALAAGVGLLALCVPASAFGGHGGGASRGPSHGGASRGASYEAPRGGAFRGGAYGGMGSAQAAAYGPGRRSFAGGGQAGGIAPGYANPGYNNHGGGPAIYRVGGAGGRGASPDRTRYTYGTGTGRRFAEGRRYGGRFQRGAGFGYGLAGGAIGYGAGAYGSEESYGDYGAPGYAYGGGDGPASGVGYGYAPNAGYAIPGYGSGYGTPAYGVPAYGLTGYGGTGTGIFSFGGTGESGCYCH